MPYSIAILKLFHVACLLMVFSVAAGIHAQTVQRNFKTFLPKPGDTIDEPVAQLVQVLLDRQEKDGNTSYMVQVIFRGSPPEHRVRKLEDRIIIDFFDCGKPAMRLAKIRGGVIQASGMEELFYKAPILLQANSEKPSSKKTLGIKRMVRFTLFVEGKVGELKFWNTLDRTLIHFRIPEPTKAKG